MNPVSSHPESTELAAAREAALKLPVDDKIALLRKLGVSLGCSSHETQSEVEARLSRAEMEAVLREADCLYDNPVHWLRLGATETIPPIPNELIEKAYQQGGRIIYRCSSISCKADALRGVSPGMVWWGEARQWDYETKVSDPGWIVVPSHIDPTTLGKPKHTVVSRENPAPSDEDLFGMYAYARLEGRQPRGYEDMFAFAKQIGAVVGSSGSFITVGRNDSNFEGFNRNIGAARFGPSRC